MVYLEVAAPRGIVTLEAAGALNPEVSKGCAYPRIMSSRGSMSWPIDNEFLFSLVPA